MRTLDLMLRDYGCRNTENLYIAWLQSYYDEFPKQCEKIIADLPIKNRFELLECVRKEWEKDGWPMTKAAYIYCAQEIGKSFLVPPIYNGVQSITNVLSVYEFLTWVIEDQDIHEFEADWNFCDIITVAAHGEQPDPIVAARDYYKYSDEENDYLQKLLLDCHGICSRDNLDINTIIEEIKTSVHIDEILEETEDEAIERIYKDRDKV